MKGKFNHRKKSMVLDNGTKIEVGTVGFLGYYAEINGQRINRQFISLDAALSFAIDLVQRTITAPEQGTIQKSYERIRGRV
jgi:hypothetical protein